jgi:hypothetical protein
MEVGVTTSVMSKKILGLFSPLNPQSKQGARLILDHHGFRNHLSIDNRHVGGLLPPTLGPR